MDDIVQAVYPANEGRFGASLRRPISEASKELHVIIRSRSETLRDKCREAAEFQRAEAEAEEDEQEAASTIWLTLILDSRARHTGRSIWWSCAHA